MLSGTLPIEAMVHQVRMLAFFGNISRLSDSSEKWLPEKSLDSHSWFVGVKKLCIKYGLPDSRGSGKNTVETLIEVHRY